VNYWLHNGYLMAEGEKMSKSLGNFYTVHDLLNEFPGEAIRLALLKTHYRQPLDFRKSGIADAKKELDEFYLALRNAADVTADVPDHPPAAVIAALSDDLNTPKAIAHLFELKTRLNVSQDAGEKARLKGELLLAGDVLGLLGQSPDVWLRGVGGAGGLSDADIEALIERRIQARAAKDFATSDRIRDELAAQGIILEDGAGSTAWRRQ